MATTYTLISSYTASGTVSSITLSSIPSTYTDLVVLGSTRSSSGATAAYVQINSNTGNNYSFTRIRATGTAATSARSAATGPAGGSLGSYPGWSTATANTFDNLELYIPNYLASQNKQLGWWGVNENNATAAYIITSAILYQNTTAISSLTFAPSDGTNYIAGSSFYLYGIKNS